MLLGRLLKRSKITDEGKCNLLMLFCQIANAPVLVSPPSTSMFVPVTWLLSALRKKLITFAISCGHAFFLKGTCVASSGSFSAILSLVPFGKMLLAIGVAMAPGQIELQRMPCLPYMAAAFLVRATTAAFVGVYAGNPKAVRAAVDAMFTIAPR